MPLQNLRHRGIPIFPKLQFSRPIDTEKSPKHLRHKIQHVPVCLDIVLRINGKHLRAVGHRPDLRLRLRQFHLARLGAQFHEAIGRPHRLKPIEIPLEPEHMVISLQFQEMRRPVRLAHLKDTHRNLLIRAVRQPQVIEQFHLRILQGIPVNRQIKTDPHFRRIHRPKLDFRAPAALPGDIAAPLYDILLRKSIHSPRRRSDPPRPVIMPGIPLHRLQERLAHRVHRKHPHSIEKAPAVFD